MHRSLDRVGLDGERDHVRLLVRGSRTHSVALVGMSGVVVIDVPVPDGAKVPLADGEHPVGTFPTLRADPPLGPARFTDHPRSPPVAESATSTAVSDKPTTEAE